MATLVLGSIGSALGGAIGGTFLGVSSAAIGGFIGSSIGSVVDSQLFGQDITNQGPRLNELNVTTSTEGSPILRLFSTSRIGGNLIWAANFKERTTTETQGGKGGGPTVTQETFQYSISFAIAFCEGNSRTTLGRIWADGKLLDTSNLDIAFYPGSETQTADPTIEGIEGVGTVPAYRGVAYIVFKDLELEGFGNRIPQITAEISKPLDTVETDSMEMLIQGVNLGPGWGETTYGTTVSVAEDGVGNSESGNAHIALEQSDIEKSLENLDSQLPNTDKVNIMTSWFGDDLRSNTCEFKPKVQSTILNTIPNAWNVGGLTRSSTGVEVVSSSGGRPAFEGTPADWSVVEAIQNVANEQGLDIGFVPVVSMDIPAGNTLPKPDGSGAGQPAYPLPAEITTSAPGVDGTAAAQTEVNSLFGSVSASDFTVNGTEVTYTGSATDFGYRRFILHYAHLCAAAANSLTDSSKFTTFLIGSGLIGLTRIRSTASGAATATYPGVNALVTLLGDVRGIFDTAGLTEIKISYAADWTEYHSHQPDDSSDDIYFNMDPLWSNAECDFIAINNFAPISDWRDGTDNEDFGTGTITDYATTGTFGSASFPQGQSIYDLDYLKGQIEGGEYYDYIYASEADRQSQTRTTISDSLDEHWVFRLKDFRNWWGQSHRERPGGVRNVAETSWTAESKPIEFTQFGCPAVNKGTNEPNVIYDSRTAAKDLPNFSNGNRDDSIQRAYFEAMITYWRDNSPTSPITMIDDSNMFAFTWDVRPYPTFPLRTDAWPDTANYDLGHFLNGRAGSLTLGQILKEICIEGGLEESDIDISQTGNTLSTIQGYVIDNISSAREMLIPLMNAYFIDAFESQGLLKFTLRQNTEFTNISLDDLVMGQQNPSGYTINRAQDTELPNSSTVSFIDPEKDYQIGAAGGVRLVGSSKNSINIRLPIVMEEEYARTLSEVFIQQDWTAREKGEIALPPSYIALDPTDGISIAISDRTLNHSIDRISRGRQLALNTVARDTSIFDPLSVSGIGASNFGISVFGRTLVEFVDIPGVTGVEPALWAPRVATYQRPYPNVVDVYQKIDQTNNLINSIRRQDIIGETTTALPRGLPWVFDNFHTVRVKLYSPNAQLLSLTEEQLLSIGGNSFAVKNSSGNWEIIQFRDATLISTDAQGLPTYELSNLLRGRLGTETEIEDSLASGSRIVMLSANLYTQALGVTSSHLTQDVDVRYGPRPMGITSASFQDATAEINGAALLPYAPTLLQGTAIEEGSNVGLDFSWVRRTRFNGDDLDQPVIPLNEDDERYDIQIDQVIVGGFNTGRTVTDLTSPNYSYTESQMTEDFGGLLLGMQFRVRVWQKSASVGRGRMAEEFITSQPLVGQNMG